MSAFLLISMVSIPALASFESILIGSASATLQQQTKPSESKSKKTPVPDPKKVPVETIDNGKGVDLNDDERVDRLWKLHRQKFVSIDGKAVRVPPLEKATVTDSIVNIPEVGWLGLVTSFTVLKVKGEADMIVAGSRTAGPGAVGGLPGKGKVKFTTVRAEPVRIVGIPTNGLVDGKAWEAKEGTAMPIAIIGTCDAKLANGNTARIFLAAHQGLIEQGITKAQFRQLLRDGVDLAPSDEELNKKK